MSYAKRENGEHVIIVLYVDDFLLAGNNMESMNWLKLGLVKLFAMKDVKEAKMWLDLEIEHQRAERNLMLMQFKNKAWELEKIVMDS